MSKKNGHKGQIDLMFLDSPEHKSKMKFNIGVSKKTPTNRDDGVETFDPNYVAIDTLLEAAGIFPSHFDSMGFKLFQQRLAKSKAIAQVDGESKMAEVDVLKKQWKLLIETVESESNNNKQSMLGKRNRDAKKSNSSDLLQTNSNGTTITHQSVCLISFGLKKMQKEQPKKKRKNNSGG